jgi:O-antigen/teichoic acid export membrane protein
MREVISRGMELSAVVAFAVFVGLAAISSSLVPILFGPKWAGVAVLCSLLSIYALVGSLGVFFYPAILASGGVGNAVWLNVIHIIGIAVACLVGIQFGVTSLVVGLILNGIVTSIPSLVFLRRRIGLSPLDFCKPFLAPAIASVFMFGTVRLIPILLPQSTWPILILGFEIAAGAAAYLGFLYMFRRGTLYRLIQMAGLSIGFSFKSVATLPPLIEE